MERDDAWRLTEGLHNELGKGDPFAASVRATRMPMIITDPRQADNPIIFINDAFLRLTGYAREEVQGRNCRFLQGPDTDKADVAKMRAALDAGTDVSVEILNYRKDGTSFWNGLYISPVRNEDGELLYFFASQVDATARREAELRLLDERERIEAEVELRTRDLRDRERELERTTGELRLALETKTTLLHEVDHRVKNNLQMVAALIALQSKQIPDEGVRKSLTTMLERVEALALVHRRLYQADDVSRFDVAAFAGDLVTDLVGSTGREDIRVDLDLESVEVSADRAAPVALVINELITNALKHAFKDGRPGKIGLSIKRAGATMVIRVSDDGVGLTEGELAPTSFGRSLVTSLARQLRGTVKWQDAAPGTCVVIEMPIEPRQDS